MKQLRNSIVLLFCFFVFGITGKSAFAHVIVTPAEVGIGQTQTFSMKVPSEKDAPTVSIKLIIPVGLAEVIPNVKAGWNIQMQKKGDMITEIDWTGGSIPQGEQDQFLFSAQVPAKETTLKWNVYQQYQDGTIVAWVNAPGKDPTDDAAPPPYSTTRVINDLTMQPESTQTKPDIVLYIVSGLSFVMGAFALWLQINKK